MKFNRTRRPFLLFYFSLFIILSIFTMAFSQVYAPKTDLKTPKNSTVSDVYSLVSGDYTQAQKDQLKSEFQSEYPNATYLEEATYSYNCHSYGWNVSEGGPLCWVGYYTTTAQDIYWNDGSYIAVTVDKGEKCSYPATANHSAIQTTTNLTFDSKWGSWVRARHNRDYCPYSPTTPVTYYALFQRTVQGQTFSNGAYQYTRRFAAYGNLAINSSTVSSGAKVDFVAGGAITIGNGFTVQNGATVKIWSWNGGNSGLAKRAIYQKSEPHMEQEPSVQALSVIRQEPQLIVLRAPEGLFVRYSIPQEAPVIIKLFDISGKLVKRFDVGIRALGNHTECCSVQNIAVNKILIVTLSAGKTTLRKKLVMR